MIGIALAAAFAGGLRAKLMGLPPLDGSLLAGFALRQAGFEPDVAIEDIAHAGVLVLLFSFGLKLRLKNLASAKVLCFGAALLHLLLFGSGLALMLVISASMPISVAFLVASALGLSSTASAAKVQEEKRELRVFHGRVAIGIWIVQGVIAVSLLNVVTGVAPFLFIVAAPLNRMADQLFERAERHPG